MTLMQNGEHNNISVAVIDVPTDPNILISPGEGRFSIENNLHLMSALNGLGFGIGPDFHKVFSTLTAERYLKL